MKTKNISHERNQRGLMDYQDIAATIGVSRQRAQQICEAAIRKALRVAKARGLTARDLI